VATRRY